MVQEGLLGRYRRNSTREARTCYLWLIFITTKYLISWSLVCLECNLRLGWSHWKKWDVAPLPPSNSEEGERPIVASLAAPLYLPSPLLRNPQINRIGLMSMGWTHCPVGGNLFTFFCLNLVILKLRLVIWGLPISPICKSFNSKTMEAHVPFRALHHINLPCFPGRAHKCPVHCYQSNIVVFIDASEH